MALEVTVKKNGKIALGYVKQALLIVVRNIKTSLMLVANVLANMGVQKLTKQKDVQKSASKVKLVPHVMRNII